MVEWDHLSLVVNLVVPWGVPWGVAGLEGAVCRVGAACLVLACLVGAACRLGVACRRGGLWWARRWRDGRGVNWSR